MGDVIFIENHLPHHLFEALCVKCFDRWIAVVADKTTLKTVECKKCGPGYVIDTGQYIMNLERDDMETHDPLSKLEDFTRTIPEGDQ